MNRLRSQARRVGITIRAQRADGNVKARAYNLIDRETGAVIYANVEGLVDLQTRLWWITRDRRFAIANRLPADGTTTESCPACGTHRVGLFRWCRSCGFDYEPESHVPSDDVVRGAGESVMFAPQPHFTQLVPPRERFGALRNVVGHVLHFNSWRELGIGAILALLVGVVVSLLLGGLR